MKKLFSKLKKWSFFIFPMIVIAISYIVPCIKLFISNNSYKKVDTLMGCNATLIGFMIATLTIYLSFPKNESIMRRMKSSGHNAIILKNNIFGIIFYMLDRKSVV